MGLPHGRDDLRGDRTVSGRPDAGVWDHRRGAVRGSGIGDGEGPDAVGPDRPQGRPGSRMRRQYDLVGGLRARSRGRCGRGDRHPHAVRARRVPVLRGGARADAAPQSGRRDRAAGGNGRAVRE